MRVRSWRSPSGTRYINQLRLGQTAKGRKWPLSCFSLVQCFRSCDNFVSKALNYVDRERSCYFRA